MKASFMCWRRIRAEIQTFRLSPKVARDYLGDREIWVVLRDVPLCTAQVSRSPKNPYASLGAREHWLGSLCVYCKLVVESRSSMQKKQRQQRQFDEKSTKIWLSWGKDMKRLLTRDQVFVQKNWWKIKRGYSRRLFVKYLQRNQKNQESNSELS